MAKIVILGLDGFNTELTKQWSDELSNLTKIQKEGIWGSLNLSLAVNPAIPH